MKIQYTSRKTQPFKDIHTKEVFLWTDSFYMKISVSGRKNALSFSDAQLCTFEPGDQVELCPRAVLLPFGVDG